MHQTAGANPGTSTRERILDVAERLLDSEGAGISLVEVAQAADVSRQTLYLLFRDRVGLMTALWHRRLQKDPARQACFAAPALPPLEAFESLFRNWIRVSLKLERAMRAIWIAEEGDPALLKVVRDADEAFCDVYRRVFQKLADAGYLRSIWTVQEAVDAAWQTTLYLVFVGHVRNMRDWSARAIEERGLKLLRAAFLNEQALHELSGSLAAQRRSKKKAGAKGAASARRAR